MILTEINLMKQIQKLNFSQQMKIISTPFNTSGFIILVITLYIYNIINKKDLFVIGQTTLIGVLLKLIFKRQRPYHYSSENIINYSGKDHVTLFDKYSFPSGHTLNATMFCLIMLAKYPKEFVFNIIAILVGFSRIFLGVHYPTDIIGGMVFGFILFNILA
jgi:undecaprenyl-diphosphatase